MSRSKRKRKAAKGGSRRHAVDSVASVTLTPGKMSGLASAISQPAGSYAPVTGQLTLSPSASSAQAETVEEHFQEVIGSEVVEKPPGVSDSQLLEEWLRLRTPRAAVNTKRLKESTPVTDDGKPIRSRAAGGAHKMRVIQIPGAPRIMGSHVVSMAEYAKRLARSENSRWWSVSGDDGPVQELRNPAAVAWAAASFQHRVGILKSAAEMVVAGVKARVARESYGSLTQEERKKLHLVETAYKEAASVDVVGDVTITGEFVGPILDTTRIESAVEIAEADDVPWVNDTVEPASPVIKDPDFSVKGYYKKAKASSYSTRQEYEELEREARFIASELTHLNNMNTLRRKDWMWTRLTGMLDKLPALCEKMGVVGQGLDANIGGAYRATLSEIRSRVGGKSFVADVSTGRNNWEDFFPKSQPNAVSAPTGAPKIVTRTEQALCRVYDQVDVACSWAKQKNAEAAAAALVSLVRTTNYVKADDSMLLVPDYMVDAKEEMIKEPFFD